MEKSKHIKIMFAGILLSFLAGYAVAAPPRVIKTVPQNGDRSVDPGLRKIRVEFDQDMSQQGYSICGGGPAYPKTIGKTRWINRRTIVMRVKLQPNHEYKLSVNCPSYKNFKNLQDEPAVVYPIEFKTGSVKEKAVKSPRLLLRQGLYAEETEGNLDKAIEIYEQIIDEASHYRQVAAKATFQLGMCYLKKGWKDQAAEYFQQVVSNYPVQTVLVSKAKQQLQKIAPQQQARLPWEVMTYIVDVHMEAYNKAQAKGLRINSHVYGVDDEFNKYFGGFMTFKNETGQVIDEEIPLGNFSRQQEMELVNESGMPQKFRMVKRDTAAIGKYRLFWTPDRPIQPGELRLLGYLKSQTQKLPETDDGYQLRMNNHFGSPVLENFFLVVPSNVEIAEQSSEYVSRKRLGIFEIYLWQKEVPANTTNTVNVVLAEKQEKSFPEFEGCKIKETIKLQLDKPEYEWWLKEPSVSKTIYENSKIEMEWDLDSIIGEKVKTFTIGVLPVDTDVSDIDGHLWWANRLAFTVRKTPYGKKWSDWSTKSKTLKPGNYRIYICALDSDENWAWKAMLDKHTIAVSTATLIIKAMPYTQVSINDIQPDGTIKMKNIIQEKNSGGTPITTKSFINSDFVHVEKMFDDKDRPIKFTAKHENDIFRYHLTFNEPVMPDEAFAYSSEGTITGLVRPLTGSKDEYQYYMRHHPGTNVPTRRIETYKLPGGAELISTTPADMAKREKDGRIELFVEEMVPPGGSITTAFQYRLAGAKVELAKPLKVNPGPWVDGEMLRFNLNTMTGMKIGQIIYTAQTARSEKESIWRIESYMNVSVSKMQQYTTVDAGLDDFAPIYGRTKNQLGDFTAEYKPDKVKLTVTAGEKETTREIKLDSAVYDNEQVLYLIRRMPLRQDYTARFSIFPVQSGAVSECRIAVTGKEKLTVSGGTFDCYAVELAVYVGQVKALEHHLWISTDRHQYLVKYDSGQAIVELAEIGLKTATAKNIELSKYGISLRLPGGWYHTENPTMGVYRFSVQLISPQIKSWLVLTGGERVSAFDSPRTAADMDIQVLKGFFKNYTVRQDSWTDLTIDSMPALSYIADYEDKAAQMVECRTYILGKSMIYWFVLRIEKDKFEEGKPEIDAIVNSFRLNRKAIRAKKLDADDLNSKGWQLWNQRKLAEAEKLFQQAVTKDPTLANAWNGLGWSQLNQGKKLNAKVSFEKCIELEPTHAAALNGLGWLAKGQGKTEEAIAHWQKAVETTPNATAALNGLTTTYMELNQYEKAVKYYKMWLKAEPDNADAKAGLKKAGAKLKRR